MKGVSNVANAAYPASNPSGYVTAAGAASAAPVQSVAGRTGAVTLTHTDITDWTATLAPYALTASVPIASTTTPAMDGTAAVGTGTTWARADHVHPNDTSRLALTGGTLTGPLALAADPTAALGAATKQYADKMLPLVGVTDGSSAPAGQIGQVIQSTLGSQAVASGGPVESDLDFPHGGRLGRLRLCREFQHGRDLPTRRKHHDDERLARRRRLWLCGDFRHDHRQRLTNHADPGPLQHHGDDDSLPCRADDLFERRGDLERAVTRETGSLGERGKTNGRKSSLPD